MTDTANTILVNGKRSDEITVFDRGLQFGDGVFETIRIHRGRPVWWDAHMNRLTDGCRRLEFEKLPDTDNLLQEVIDNAARFDTGTLKIIITRGNSNSGYRIPDDISDNIIMIFSEGGRHEEIPETGIMLGLCRHYIPSPSLLAGIKHLNRLEQVMARKECTEQGWDEGVMLDSEERVIEGTMSNIFAWYGDKLITPMITQAGVKGICRDVIMEQSMHAVGGIEECEISVSELLQSDGIFVCNSLIGIWPVRHFLDREFDSNRNTFMLQQMIEEAMCS